MDPGVSGSKHCLQNCFCSCCFKLQHSWLTMLLVSGVQESDWVILMHVSILFQNHFPFRLLQNVEFSSLFYPVGAAWLSILCIVMRVCSSQTTNSSTPSNTDCNTPGFPLWKLRDCSPSLWICFYFVNKFVRIVFIDSAFKQCHICLSVT